jgi:regulator of replication initiation timing
MISQANTQNETIQAVQQSQTELAKIMQEMRNELKESREENKQLRQEMAGIKNKPANNENTNPNSNNSSWGNGNSAADDGKRCKHCGGRHISRPNRKGKILPEDECSGKGWPASAHKGMPDYFIDMMNKHKGTNVKKADLL